MYNMDTRRDFGGDGGYLCAREEQHEGRGAQYPIQLSV